MGDPMAPAGGGQRFPVGAAPAGDTTNDFHGDTT